jgi:hypothetical protein
MWHPRYCDPGVELSGSKCTAKQRQPKHSTLLAVPVVKLAPLQIPPLKNHMKDYQKCFEVVIDANRGAVFIGTNFCFLYSNSLCHRSLFDIFQRYIVTEL